MGSQKSQEVEYSLPSRKEVREAGLEPKQFRSVIPPAYFERRTEYANYLRDRLNEARANRFSMVGTPAEIGARDAGRRAATQAAYASSLPAGDQYSPGAFLANAPAGDATDPYAQLRAQTQNLYAQALADAEAKRAEAAVEPSPIPDIDLFEGYKTPRVTESRVKPWKKGQNRGGGGGFRRRRRERERNRSVLDIPLQTDLG